MTEIVGLGVSPGLAVGPAIMMPDLMPEPPPAAPLPEDTRERAWAQVEAASAQVRAELEQRATQAGREGRAILEATALMVADPTLLGLVRRKVTEAGTTPERAVWEAAGDVAEMLASAGDHLAQRVADVHDVRERLICALAGRPAPGIPCSDQPFVLIATDLAPADTATLDQAVVVALVTEQGGPTSHTAILARALGIPAVVAAAGVLERASNATVLVDGSSGVVTVGPAPADVERARARRAGPAMVFNGQGATSDGHRVPLLANIGDPAGVAEAALTGAEGVGLFRTEFCFLDRTEEPSVDEQVEAYRRVFAAFPGRKVVVRTLDAGADKPLPFLTAADEPNPALGMRGLRTSNRRPQVLANQLSALVRAAAAHDAEVWVMAPMVATAAEAAAFAELAHGHGLPVAGTMVEVPAAALCADAVLGACDFASIGTNDLAQYTMAADRQLGAMASLNDPWQPALLRLIATTAETGRRLAKPVGVCGEAAADPDLACVLVGLGVSSLSMTPRAIPAVAARLASVSLDVCDEAARRAVTASSPAEARQAAAAPLRPSAAHRSARS